MSLQTTVSIGSSCITTEEYEVTLNNWHFYNDGTAQLGNGVPRIELTYAVLLAEPLVMLNDDEMLNFFNLEIPPELPYSVTDESGQVASSSRGSVLDVNNTSCKIYEIPPCEAKGVNEVVLCRWHFYKDGNIQFGDNPSIKSLDVCKSVRQYVYEHLSLMKNRHMVENMMHHLTKEFPQSKMIEMHKKIPLV